jgi:hypothetical protein
MYRLSWLLPSGERVELEVSCVLPVDKAGQELFEMLKNKPGLEILYRPYWTRCDVEDIAQRIARHKKGNVR